RQRGGTGGHGLQSTVDHRLRQNGGGRGAVTGDVVGLGGDFLRELRAEIFVGVVDVYLTSNGHTIVSDGGRAELLVDDDVAALGAERHLDGVGEGVDATLEATPSALVELQNLRHVLPFGGIRRTPR